MLKIIANKVISEQHYNIPKILPNNLGLIQLNYGISNSDIANALSLKKRFIDSVYAEDANFSGSSIIKFIKHYNIPFNLFYNVNKETTYEENTYKRHICIFQVSKDYLLDTEDQLKTLNMNLITSAIDNSIINPDDNIKIQFILQIENGQLSYDKNIRSSNYKCDLEKYQKFVNSFTYDVEKYYYFAMCYELIEDITVTKTINLNQNFDMDLIKYLETKPFVKHVLKDVNIPKDEIKEEGNFYILPNKYPFLINDAIKNLDKVNINSCKDKRKHIVITVVSKTINQLSKLKFIREYKNYSIQEMADKICVSEDTYAAIEKGYLKISAQIMWKLELEFGLPLEYILNIDEYYNKYCK